jgi:hypothetical protein
MEFIKANLINTTTQIAVNSNTLSVSSLFNRNPIYQYYSDGLTNDLTTASITITFGTTTPVSRIALLDINVSGFNLFYNGLTANAFTLLNDNTTSSSYTANADAYKYFTFSTVQCSSITLELKSTLVANSEKVIGMLLLSDLYFEMERIPSANNYKPRQQPKQIVHKMSDGGTKIHNISKKWNLDISYEYLSESFKDSLDTLYSLQTPFNFVGLSTYTGWDGFVFEAVWEGPFDFHEYSNNAQSAGFGGTIRLRETPT